MTNYDLQKFNGAIYQVTIEGELKDLINSDGRLRIPVENGLHEIAILIDYVYINNFQYLTPVTYTYNGIILDMFEGFKLTKIKDISYLNYVIQRQRYAQKLLDFKLTERFPQFYNNLGSDQWFLSQNYTEGIVFQKDTIFQSIGCPIETTTRPLIDIELTNNILTNDTITFEISEGVNKSLHNKVLLSMEINEAGSNEYYRNSELPLQRVRTVLSFVEKPVEEHSFNYIELDVKITPSVNVNLFKQSIISGTIKMILEIKDLIKI